MLEEQYGDARNAVSERIEVTTAAPEPLEVVRAASEGHFDSDRQLLLDHQTRNRVPGYQVWTPLMLDSGGLLMVNRGWVAANPDRSQLPDVQVDDRHRRVEGFWRPLPRPGYVLESDPCRDIGFPRAVSYPSADQLQCIFRAAVANGVLLLDPADADGFIREWTLPNPVPPARHYGYAAQWFAFAATLLFLFFWLNLKKKDFPQP